MATGMNFALLQADLRAYLERGSSVDATVYNQIPRIINLSEQNIAAELKLQGFINVVTNTMTDGVSVYAKPSRWRETVEMFYGSGSARAPLYPREYGYCRMYWPDDTATDSPLFYADYDYNNWLFAPTPDSGYSFEVVYYQLPALLDDTNTTNWLTDYAPQMILYRALWELAMFLKDDRAETFKQQYAQSAQSLSTQDLQKIVDRTSTRQEA